MQSLSHHISVCYAGVPKAVASVQYCAGRFAFLSPLNSHLSLPQKHVPNITLVDDIFFHDRPQMQDKFKWHPLVTGCMLLMLINYRQSAEC